MRSSPSIMTSAVSVPAEAHLDSTNESSETEIIELIDKHKFASEVQTLTDDVLTRLPNVQQRTLFSLWVSTSSVPRIVDPRNSVARQLFGDRAADFTFRMVRDQWVFLNSLALAGQMIATPGIIGVAPASLSYAAGIFIPYSILIYSNYNYDLLKAILFSFEFIGMVSLALIFMIGMIDALSDSFPRAFGITCQNSICFYIASSDARMPAKEPKLWFVFADIWFVLSIWCFIGIWYSGSIVGVKQTVIRVNNEISIDIQSTAISCLVTFAILLTKKVHSQLRYRHQPNTMFLLKPKAFYKRLDRA